MDDLRVIRADFANWRPVQGRKVVQLILEVPIEQTHEVMMKLGVPMPGESKWVAVALLEYGRCAGESADGEQRNARKPFEGSETGDGPIGNTPSPTTAPIATGGTSATQPKERRPFASLPLSQQAAIRCQDNDFKLFLGASNADDAVHKVREFCGVESRSKIIDGERSGALWHDMEQQFQSWLTDQRYAGVRR